MTDETKSIPAVDHPDADGNDALEVTQDGDNTVLVHREGTDTDTIVVNTAALRDAIPAAEDTTTTDAPTPISGNPPPQAEPVNEGESLDRTDSNPEIDPVAPGVEPGDAPAPAPNAPTSTNPEGDTAQQNAPDAPAPEPGGPNVATNPGTASSSDAQTEVPPGTTSTSGEQVPEATPPADPGDQGSTPAEGSEQPEQTPVPGATGPAAEMSEKPLYDYTGNDPASIDAEAWTDSGLRTPTGVPLYHYSGDTAGQPATGAGEQWTVYADDEAVVASS